VKVVPIGDDDGGEPPWPIIGAVVAIVAVVGVVAIFMRRKPPQAPASAPVEAPAASAEEAVVVAEEAPAPAAPEGEK